MSVLKWILIICGFLFLVVLAVAIGGYFWAKDVEPIALTSADLKTGGTFSADERQTMLAACQKNMKAPDDDKTACTCIADKAATDLSRFERLVLTAGFEGSATKIVAITKGLMQSGIPEAEVKAADEASKQNLDTVMTACGLTSK